MRYPVGKPPCIQPRSDRGLLSPLAAAPPPLAPAGRPSPTTVPDLLQSPATPTASPQHPSTPPLTRCCHHCRLTTWRCPHHRDVPVPPSLGPAHGQGIRGHVVMPPTGGWGDFGIAKVSWYLRGNGKIKRDTEALTICGPCIN
jgi:hypothetical protein